MNKFSNFNIHRRIYPTATALEKAIGQTNGNENSQNNAKRPTQNFTANQCEIRIHFLIFILPRKTANLLHQP